MTVLIRERVTRRAGLALRVRDLSTGGVVSDGIAAQAWSEDDPRQRVDASAPTALGILGFVRLPGLPVYEDGTTPRADWFASPLRHPPRPFVVRVIDRRGTHLPIVRRVLAPAALPIEVALPRSVTSPALPGHLSVTVQVVTEAGGPAAWALVELSVGGLTTGGFTDTRGMVAVPVPIASPPTQLGTAVSGPSWRIAVRARYRPADQIAAAGADADDPPTFSSIATQQYALIRDGGAFVPGLDRDATTDGPLVVASDPLPAPQILVIRPAP
jgi:hypothetical protein